MNNVVLIGRLTKDPELSYTPNNQTPVCRFTVAVDRPRRNGEDMGADFIRITVWGKQAENCDRYIAKGRQVGVSGRIQTGSYKNKEGITVYTTEIVADRVEFLGGGNQSNAPVNNESSNEASAPDMSAFDDMPDSFQAAEDDIPF